jgi:NAD(P)-dependent dehydrogenase (short-subunit alcohol dehydrogenase family)
MGKIALVTGAAARVGREIALALAGRGMRVIVHYNNSQTEAEATRAEISVLGGECFLVKADLRSKAEIDEMARVALAQWGAIDLLVNNAAIYFKTPFAELTVEAWDQFIDVNLRATFLCSQIFGLAMKARGSGKIINIADWAVDRPYGDYLPYCVSKAGVITLTKGLARALAPEVQVNAISPGAVLLSDDYPADRKERAIAHTLVKHLGKPGDIASAVCFLAESDFITGINIVIDGGRLIYG